MREAYGHVRVVDDLTSHEVEHDPDVESIEHKTWTWRGSSMTKTWRGVDCSREAYGHVRVVDDLTYHEVDHDPDVERGQSM